MRIKSLTLINFKKFEKVTLTFEKINELHGANGAGKTTILEAITLGYYGKLPDGTNDISKVIKFGEKSCSIIIEDLDIGLITRKIKERGSELLIDGKKESQDNLQSLYRLTPPEYFLASVNPNYWKELDYKERRAILSDLTPKVDRNQVFSSMYPERLLEKFKIMTYQEVNKEIKDLENTIEQTKGILQQIKIDLNNPIQYKEEYIDMNRLHLLEEKKREYDLIKPDWVKIQTLNSDTKVLEQYKSTQVRFEEIQHAIANLKVKYSFFSATDKQGKIMGVEIVENIVKSKNKIVETITKSKLKLEEYETLIQQQNEAVTTSKCPVCGQDINNHSFVVVTEEDLSKLRNEIKELEVKLAQVETWEFEINEYNRELAAYKAESTPLISVLKNPRLESLSLEIEVLTKRKDEIESKYKEIGWTDEMNEELQKLKETKLRYEGRTQMAKLTDEKLNKEKEAHVKKVEEYIASLEDYKILQEALSPKGIDSEVAKRKAIIIEEVVSKYASGIKIETLEPLKSGEGYKEVFNVFKNNIQEKKLSTGQKMVLAVGFCLTVQELLNEKFGYKPSILFMDDSSLITSLDKIKKVAKDIQQFYAINTLDEELKLINTL